MFWFHIFTMIDDHGKKVSQDPVHIQFINSINNEEYVKVMLCNNISNHIVQKGDNYIVWGLKGITTHEEPFITSQPNYKGYCCNVMVYWGTGDTTTDSLTIIIGGDTITCALCVNDN